MNVGDASDTVTICKGQGLFLRADAAGLLIRNFHFGSARRIAWSEIDSFTDGRYTKEAVTSWMLVIVLRTGKEVPVLCSVLWPTSEVLSAIREAAQQHGIPADLAGIPMKAGRPVRRGLYHDPGGQTGLRYWDGRQWSPLLPPDIAPPAGETVQPSSASWSELPKADAGWTYAAARAVRLRVWVAVIAVVSAGLIAGGVLDELGDHVTGNKGFDVFMFFIAALLAVLALGAFQGSRFSLKLDEAANGVRDHWSRRDSERPEPPTF